MVSLQWYIVKIYHSGQKSSIWFENCYCHVSSGEANRVLEAAFDFDIKLFERLLNISIHDF